MTNPVATLVYFLCFATSAGCGWLLVRRYLRIRNALLLWTAACFVLLSVNNLMVVFDLVILPNVDFRPARIATHLAALATLLYGFIWELE